MSLVQRHTFTVPVAHPERGLSEKRIGALRLEVEPVVPLPVVVDHVHVEHVEAFVVVEQKFIGQEGVFIFDDVVDEHLLLTRSVNVCLLSSDDEHFRRGLDPKLFALQNQQARERFFLIHIGRRHRLRELGAEGVDGLVFSQEAVEDGIGLFSIDCLGMGRRVSSRQDKGCKQDEASDSTTRDHAIRAGL